jgi:hypothetical protein
VSVTAAIVGPAVTRDALRGDSSVHAAGHCTARREDLFIIWFELRSALGFITAL